MFHVEHPPDGIYFRKHSNLASALPEDSGESCLESRRFFPVGPERDKVHPDSLLPKSQKIPTRKMKLNSKRFCLGDLIPFDFS